MRLYYNYRGTHDSRMHKQDGGSGRGSGGGFFDRLATFLVAILYSMITCTRNPTIFFPLVSIFLT